MSGGSLPTRRSELRLAHQELERLHELIAKRHEDLSNRVDDFEVAKRRWKQRIDDHVQDRLATEERRLKQEYELKLSRIDELLSRLKREVGTFRQLRDEAATFKFQRDECHRELVRAREVSAKRAKLIKSLEEENKDLKKRAEIAQWRVGKLREEGRDARRRQRSEPALSAAGAQTAALRRQADRHDARHRALGEEGALHFVDATVRILEAPLPPAGTSGGGPSALVARVRPFSASALPHVLPAICEVLPAALRRPTGELRRLLAFLWAMVYFTPRPGREEEPAVGQGVGSSVPADARAAYRLHRVIELLAAPAPAAQGHEATAGAGDAAKYSPGSPAPAPGVADAAAAGGWSPFLAHRDSLVRTLSALLVARFARHADSVAAALRVLRREVASERGRGEFNTYWGLLALCPLLESRLSSVTRAATSVLLAMASRGSHRKRFLAMCAQPYFLAACVRLFAPDRITALSKHDRAVREAAAIVIELLSERRATRQALSQAGLVPRLREWVHCAPMIRGGGFLVANLRAAVESLQTALMPVPAPPAKGPAAGEEAAARAPPSSPAGKMRAHAPRSRSRKAALPARGRGARRSRSAKQRKRAADRAARGEREARRGHARRGGTGEEEVDEGEGEEEEDDEDEGGEEGGAEGRSTTLRGSGRAAAAVRRAAAFDESSSSDGGGEGRGPAPRRADRGDRSDASDSEGSGGSGGGLGEDDVAVLGLVRDLEEELASAVFSGPDGRGVAVRRSGRELPTAASGIGHQSSPPRPSGTAAPAAVARDGAAAPAGRAAGGEAEAAGQRERASSEISRVSGSASGAEEGAGPRPPTTERGSDGELLVYSSTLAAALDKSAPAQQRGAPARRPSPTPQRRVSPASSPWSSEAGAPGRVLPVPAGLWDGRSASSDSSDGW